ncbi:MAG: hypothetical protein E6R08_08645 [Nevskiaceae bacterium]|nr:MAG: hypothetical protein E6R08_08645 [Nevskiaceae bacterium]
MFGTGKRPKTGFAELQAKLDAWSIPNDALDRIHDAAKISLGEVKALTEYEDGKASRLLTIVAFLSALVGAVFTRFTTDYPWPGFGALDINSPSTLTMATYVAFFIYVLLVTASVLIVLIAVQPRFNVPETWKGSTGVRPASTLFYKGILDVSAPTWGDTFANLAANEGKDLKAFYAKCYIQETYLVAEKVAVKLRLLSPGVRLLQAAMCVLLIFFLLSGANAIMVKSSAAASATKTPPPVAPAANPAPSKKGG